MRGTRGKRRGEVLQFFSLVTDPGSATISFHFSMGELVECIWVRICGKESSLPAARREILRDEDLASAIPRKAWSILPRVSWFDLPQKCPADRYTEWGTWSPCSSSCGPGVKLRSRLLKSSKSWTSPTEDDDGGNNYEQCKLQQAVCVAEIPNCDFSKDEALSTWEARSSFSFSPAWTGRPKRGESCASLLGVRYAKT